jgi:hypothetical protein
VTFSEKDLTMKISRGISISMLLALYHSSSKLRNHMYFFLHESGFLLKASDSRNEQVLMFQLHGKFFILSSSTFWNLVTWNGIVTKSS